MRCPFLLLAGSAVAAGLLCVVMGAARSCSPTLARGQRRPSAPLFSSGANFSRRFFAPAALSSCSDSGCCCEPAPQRFVRRARRFSFRVPYVSSRRRFHDARAAGATGEAAALPDRATGGADRTDPEPLSPRPVPVGQPGTPPGQRQRARQ